MTITYPYLIQISKDNLSSRELSDERFLQIAKSLSREEKIEIAKNPNCPKRVLRRLSWCYSRNIRWNVFINPNTPSDIVNKMLEKFINENNLKILFEMKLETINFNRKSMEILFNIYFVKNNAEYRLREKLAKFLIENLKTPSSVLIKLIDIMIAKEEPINRILLKREKLDTKIIRKLFEVGETNELLKYNNCPATIKNQIIKKELFYFRD